MSSTNPTGISPEPIPYKQPSTETSKKPSSKGKPVDPAKANKLSETARQNLPSQEETPLTTKPIGRKVKQQDKIESSLNPSKKIQKDDQNSHEDERVSFGSENISEDKNLPKELAYVPCDTATEGSLEPGTPHFKLMATLGPDNLFDINYDVAGDHGKPKLEVKLYQYRDNFLDPTKEDRETTTIKLSALAITPHKMWEKFDPDQIMDLYFSLQDLVDTTFKDGPAVVHDNLAAAVDNLTDYLELY